MVLVTGCETTTQGTSGSTPTSPAPPTYAEVAARYNRQVAGLDQFWARATVVLEWYEDGKRRSEQGEGTMMVVLPRNLALSVGKVGNTMMWFGSDAERYWLFNLHDKVTYHGLQANIGRPCAQSLPLPVVPNDVPRVLGMMPLPLATETAPPVMEPFADNTWLVEVPGEPIRLLLDRRTLHPVRIDLLGPNGYSAVIARLRQHERVETQGQPPGAWPFLAQRVEVEVVGQRGKLVLHLSEVSDGRAGDKIRDRVFSFDFLQRVHRTEQVVRLDAECEPDALPAPAAVTPVAPEPPTVRTAP